MRFLRWKFLVLLAALIVAGTTAAIAISAVISRTAVSSGTSLYHEFRKTTAVDFDSGWIVHPGLVVLQVQEGSFQIYQGSCTPRTVEAGQTLVEIPYEPIRAIAKGRVVWTSSFFINGDDPVLIPLAVYSPNNPNPCPGIG